MPQRRRPWGRLRAVILDAYGTLFHYEREKLLTVFQSIVSTYGLSVDADVFLERWRIHESAFRSARVFQKDGEWRTSETFVSYQEAWATCFHKAYADLGISGGPEEEGVSMMLADLHRREVYVEVLQALEALRARVPLVLLSNAGAPFLFRTLEHNGLAFEIVVYSEEERVYKPHPRIFQRALERIGAEAHEVLYVGDSPTEDVVGATAVGIPTVWINRTEEEWPLSQESRPTHEVPDLLGLIDVVTSRSGVVY